MHHVETIVFWVVQSLAALAVGCIAVIWKQLNARLVLVENQVNNIIGTKLDDLNKNVLGISGQLAVTNTKLQALDARLDDRVARIEADSKLLMKTALHHNSTEK